MHSRTELNPDSDYSAWIDGHPTREIANSCVILDSDSGNDLGWRNFYCTAYRALPICETDPVQDNDVAF